MDAASWDERYRSGDLPWDTGKPDEHLVRAVDEYAIEPRRALEIGCGTGTNAIWLARQGFEVTGADIARTAINAARDKAAAAGVAVSFLVCDILKEPVPGGPFSFVFDRGCFHSFDSHPERVAFADAVAGLLDRGGLWFSEIGRPPPGLRSASVAPAKEVGSTDGEPREVGPPRLSASEVASAVEGRFELLSLRASRFDDNGDRSPEAWLCMMKRRPDGTAPAD